MVLYECPRCDYVCSMKSTMNVHIKRKNPCKFTKLDICLKDHEEQILNRTFNITRCLLCNVVFSDKNIYNDHKLECDKKILDKIKNLEDKLAQRSAQIITDIDGDNNVVNNNIINVTIQLRPYNDPKLADDMDDIYEDAWGKKKSIPTFIERLHLSGDLPENNNMCITNLRTKLAKVFTEQGWMTRDQDLLLDEIISNSSHLMDKWVKAKKNRKEYEKRFH